MICVLGLAAVIGVVAANSGKDKKSDTSGPVVSPSGATGKDSLAIPVGKDGAKSTLTVWEDFRCPACQAFEAAYRPTIKELTDSGELKVEYHLVTLIDGNMGGSGSRKAANAAACAQDSRQVPRVPRRAVRQSAQGDRRRLRRQRQADRAHAARSTAWTPRPSAHASTTAPTTAGSRSRTPRSRPHGFSGTPTVLLGGKNIYADQSMTPAKLKQMVQDANKG